jgi:HAD superfamily hydrolase (TIGR01509 family)
MNGRGYRGVVFDMDGVLADSEPVYFAAVNTLLAPLGKRITEEQHVAFMGHGVEETWRQVIDFLQLDGDLPDYIGPYDRELCRLLAEVREPLPGVRETIAELRRRGVALGLASSSWPGWIDALLGGIGLRGAFDAVVSATMVERPKPAPDLYLLAASRLRLPPEACIAIEDTPTGLRSAKAAGMLAVQVRAASSAFPPLVEADLVLDSLERFDFGLLSPIALD